MLTRLKNKPNHIAYREAWDSDRYLFIGYGANFDFYSSISRKYKDFEFTDSLSDNERLDEYAQVYQQFRKFVGSKMSTVMGMQEHLDSILVWVEDQVKRSDIYPKTRVEMVYTSLKLDWLRSVGNQVAGLMEQMGR